MEKLHKYCLGVLLVIICTNVSSQFNIEVIKNQHLLTTCEFCDDDILLDDILVNDTDKTSSVKKLSLREKITAKNLWGGNLFPKSSFHHSDNKELYYYEDFFLINDNQLNNANIFAEFSYFKVKNSKVRNKDYLDKVAS